MSNKDFYKQINELLNKYENENNVRLSFISFKRDIVVSDNKESDVWKVKTVYEENYEQK